MVIFIIFIKNMNEHHSEFYVESTLVANDYINPFGVLIK